MRDRDGNLNIPTEPVFSFRGQGDNQVAFGRSSFTHLAEHRKKNALAGGGKSGRDRQESDSQMPLTAILPTMTNSVNCRRLRSMPKPDEREIAYEPDAAEAQATALFAKQAERLRAEVPIAKVVSGYTKLRRTKKRFLGYCPLHEGTKPTLRVEPRTNTFHCFNCGAGGDAIRFLQEVEYLTYGQALEALEKIRYSDEQPDDA